MGVRSLIAILAVGLTFGMVACSKDPQKIVPETRGKRGESCLARNDCNAGLACIDGTCQKNEFAIDVAVKHCDIIECTGDQDCCGDKALEAPARCNRRPSVCLTPQVDDCTSTTCTDATAATVCGDGVCQPGTCSNSFATACTTLADCADTCVVPVGATQGNCAVSGNPCLAGMDATYCPSGSCGSRFCDCSNPEYDTSDPICMDEACLDICVLRCDENRCVEDDSCEEDVDCIGSPSGNLCDGGRCVQCIEDEQCDEEAEETCEAGQCHRPCKFDEECGLFEDCNLSTGDCEYRGCNSSRECILAAARGLDGTGGGTSVGSGDDPRMFECLPSDTEEDIKVCKIPCENDGSCGQFQVCDAGYCRFIGCDSHADCKAYLGITNQVTNEAKPYVTQAVCEE